VHHIPMLSPGSTSLAYADKSMYPYLLRTVGSDKLQFEAFVQLALNFGWRRLAGLVQQSAYGLSQLAELEASVSRGGLVLWGQILVKTGRCGCFASAVPMHSC
jgi:ABC-type branched-subunit amino acid transport system substrate-binding protein